MDYDTKFSDSSLVKTGTLSNGIKYVYMKNNVKPGRFSTYLHVNTGSTNEQESEQGISHMLEHMAFDNSVDYPGRGGVWHAIERADVGYFNAFTSFRSTVYMLLDVATSSTGKDADAMLDQAMKILYNQVRIFFFFSH
jgi:zinc protease